MPDSETGVIANLAHHLLTHDGHEPKAVALREKCVGSVLTMLSTMQNIYQVSTSALARGEYAHHGAVSAHTLRGAYEVRVILQGSPWFLLALPASSDKFSSGSAHPMVWDSVILAFFSLFRYVYAPATCIPLLYYYCALGEDVWLYWNAKTQIDNCSNRRDHGPCVPSIFAT